MKHMPHMLRWPGKNGVIEVPENADPFILDSKRLDGKIFLDFTLWWTNIAMENHNL